MCYASRRAMANGDDLDEEERQAVRAVLAREHATAPGYVATTGPLHPGDYAIVDLIRPMRVLPFVLLGIIVMAMGQPLWGVALLTLACLGWLFPRRIRGFRIDVDGQVHLPVDNGSPLPWPEVACVRVVPRTPRMGSAITRAARTELEVVFELADGRSWRFAGGQFFRRAPERHAVELVFVQQHLQGLCRQHGLCAVVKGAGFEARR